jgi:hypothetical protein
MILELFAYLSKLLSPGPAIAARTASEGQNLLNTGMSVDRRVFEWLLI